VFGAKPKLQQSLRVFLGLVDVRRHPDFLKDRLGGKD
jgi:hypothetical protein